MTRDEHLARAGRVLASLRKLAFPDDYLAIVDGATIAGYHLGNALLHGHCVAPDAEHSNTPSKLTRPVSALPTPIQRAFEAFTELEKLRFDYVRSPSTYDERLASAVWHNLETMLQACRALTA
jgi:hypothetical protein